MHTFNAIYSHDQHDGKTHKSTHRPHTQCTTRRITETSQTHILNPPHHTHNMSHTHDTGKRKHKSHSPAPLTRGTLSKEHTECRAAYSAQVTAIDTQNTHTTYNCKTLRTTQSTMQSPNTPTRSQHRITTHTTPHCAQQRTQKTR